MKQSPEPVRRDVRGVVSNFLPRKGYGFLQSQEGTKVFVHYSDIKGMDYKTLNQGDEVVYDVVQGAKGLQAVNVRVTRSIAGNDNEDSDTVAPPKRKW